MANYNLIQELPLSQGAIKKGTFLFADNAAMSQASQIGSQLFRAMLVVNIIDGIAYCCPLSSTSDAWNAEVSPHFIPQEFNPRLFNYKDSLFAVNRVVRDGYSKYPVSFLQTLKRVDLPIEFVNLARQLEGKFASDMRSGVLRRTSRTRYKDARIKEAIRRVDLTTDEIISTLYPST